MIETVDFIYSRIRLHVVGGSVWKWSERKMYKMQLKRPEKHASPARVPKQVKNVIATPNLLSNNLKIRQERKWLRNKGAALTQSNFNGKVAT